MAEDASVGLLVRIEAKEGREDDVEQFLQQGRSLVEDEPGTVRWFGIRFGPRSFAVYMPTSRFNDAMGTRALSC